MPNRIVPGIIIWSKGSLVTPDGKRFGRRWYSKHVTQQLDMEGADIEESCKVLIIWPHRFLYLLRFEHLSTVGQEKVTWLPDENRDFIVQRLENRGMWKT